LPYSSIKRSTFYHQPKRSARRLVSDRKLLAEIQSIKHKHRDYGYRRVTDELHNRSYNVNHKRVQRLMKEHDLAAQMFNKQTRKYDSSIGPQGRKAKNRLHRRFNTDRSYQKMTTDISEFRYGNGTQQERVFLSPIKDLHDNTIACFAIGDHPTTELVMKPLKKLIQQRPTLNYRMTIHSDQGIQYQSTAWRRTLKKHHIFQSMSRRGTCLDNAPMESFFHLMKVELYYDRHFETKAELVKAMKEWIHYYNYERIQHKLKGKTPMEYRHLALEKVA
jgi:putative transposase